MIQLRRVTATAITDVNRFIIDTCEAFNKLSRDPWFRRKKITANVGTSATQVSHGLNSLPNGVVIVSQNANAVVWQPSPATETLITLQATSPVTVQMEVY